MFKSSTNGQAFVELIIGIIVIVTIVAGGIQYFYTSNAHRHLTTTIRGEVGEQALIGSSTSLTPAYILNWDYGADNIRHTDDDTAITAMPTTLFTITDCSVKDPTDWNLLKPLKRENPMMRMHESLTPTTELALINVEKSDTISVDQAVRTFIFDRPTITVRHSVWMPLLGDL